MNQCEVLKYPPTRFEARTCFPKPVRYLYRIPYRLFLSIEKEDLNAFSIRRDDGWVRRTYPGPCGTTIIEYSFVDFESLLRILARRRILTPNFADAFRVYMRDLERSGFLELSDLWLPSWDSGNY